MRFDGAAPAATCPMVIYRRAARIVFRRATSTSAGRSSSGDQCPCARAPTAHRVNPIDLGLWVAPGFRDRESPCRCMLPGCDHVGATACPAALPVVKALL